MRVGQYRAQRLLPGAGTDDHEPGVRQGVDRGEVCDLLLGGQPPHVSHEPLAAAHALAPRVIAQRGTEPARVHSAAPHVHPLDAMLVELADRRRGGSEREGRTVVHRTHVGPHGGLQHGRPVACGVTGHVRLVHGHARQTQTLGGLDGLPPEHERGRHVHHVRGEAGQDALHATHGAARHADLGIARERQRRDALDPYAVHVVHRAQEQGLLVGGGDHHGLVPVIPQVFQDADHRMSDTVDVGEELFGHQCNSHGSHCGPGASRGSHPGVARR